MSTASQRKSAVYLALFMAGCFVAFLIIFSIAGGRIVPGQEGYRVEVVVPDALGLSKNADVRQAGVQIGKVAESRVLGRTTALMVELEDEQAPIYGDAQVLIRTKSVAGENYLELDPGHPDSGAVPDGGRLSIAHAKEATQLDQVLSVLDEDRRRQLQGALEGLGGGLEGNGKDLNQVLAFTSDLVRDGDSLFETLAAEREHVAGLVDSLGPVTRALGERRDAIQIFVRQAKVTAEAVAARDAELEDTLAALPPFLAQAETTAARLGDFSAEATPVVRELRLAMGELAPAVEELRLAAPAGRDVVAELEPFATALTPAVEALGPFSDAASTAIPPLSATLRHTNPMLEYLSPYWRELPTTFAEIGAATKYRDSVGHLGRLALMFGSASLPGTLPVDEAESLERFYELVGRRVSTLGVNAYPAPGEAGLSTPFTGEYPRVEADPRYGRSP